MSKIDLYKGDCLEFSKIHYLEDLTRHPLAKEIIVMKSSAVGKTTFIPEYFDIAKKRIEDTVVEKGLIDE